MLSKTVTFAFAFLLFFSVLLCSLNGQNLTAQVAGTVLDPSGAAVTGAKVTLLNSGTGQTREGATDNSGAFVFIELLPGEYQVTVEASGFKRYEEREITVSATERVTLRQITLVLGSVSETVSVTAEAARLQTQSAERSGLIDTSEMRDLSLAGRDYLGMMRLLPGVSDSANRQTPGFNDAGTGGLVGLNMSGNREHTVNVTLDGISDLETGSQSGPWISPSLDSIGEVKVLLTNYQAEYGRTSGGTINIVTRNGTKEFHGGGYYFMRNEDLNANNYFNNRQGIPRPYYRFNDVGYTLGGPVLLPRLLHRRDKLFFFFSEEFIPHKVPGALTRRTFPTALERQGNFSQTLDTTGKIIPITDPLNNGVAFPGNIIPANRINQGGQGLLNIMPLPNTYDPNHTFNDAFVNVETYAWRQELLRLDYNISRKDLFYVRLVDSHQDYSGGLTTNGASNWPMFPTYFDIGGHGLVATLIHTFSASLINEFAFGVNRGTQHTGAENQAALNLVNRQTLGLNLPEFYPQANPMQLIPNVTFGGVSNAPALTIEARFPYIGNGNVWNWSDNLTKVMGKHNIKLGVYIENAYRNGPRTSTATGAFDFSRNASNSYDTNYAFSNAILGSVNTYSESDSRPYSKANYQNYEWFVQDSWRVTRRLTLDVGARFYYVVPTHLSSSEQVSAFSPALYNPATAPAFIQPYRASPSSARVGINPVTGVIVSPALIGTFAPNTGDVTDGMKVDYGKVLGTNPVSVTPRFGFAWDVFGNGKTAVRGGFGIYLDRLTDTIITSFTQYPPAVNTFTAYWTTIPQLLSATRALSPVSVQGIQGTYQPQATYNWSFGVQRDIGLGTVLDVAYVANVGRHLQEAIDINATPYGTNFLPSSADATNPGSPLPPNFLRPIKGYGDISYFEFAGTLNYHSMQTQLHRRVGKSLTFGGTWTWSKSMDLTEADSSAALNPYLNPRMRNYGKSGFDHTHNLAISYIYSLPRPFARWDNGFSRVMLDRWQVSGITSFISGIPNGFTYTFVQSQDITGATGTGIDSRVILTGNPVLPKGDRTRYRAFNTAVVQPPVASNFGIGNAPKDAFRDPGTNNWDISLFKNFPLGKKEARRLQFRAETYNTFNHTQFSAVDTAARFAANGQQTNNDFGAYTAARDARRIVLGLKVYF